MIHTSKQLKDLVRNLSKGNSMQAQILIRNYMMERFLERLSRSPFQSLSPVSAAFSPRILYDPIL